MVRWERILSAPYNRLLESIKVYFNWINVDTILGPLVSSLVAKHPQVDNQVNRFIEHAGLYSDQVRDRTSILLAFSSEEQAAAFAWKLLMGSIARYGLNVPCFCSTLLSHAV